MFFVFGLSCDSATGSCSHHADWFVCFSGSVYTLPARVLLGIV